MDVLESEDGYIRVQRWVFISPKIDYSSPKMDVLETEPEVRRRGVSEPCDVVIPGHVQLVGGAVAGMNHYPTID